MRRQARSLDSLRPSDLEGCRIWKYARDSAGDNTWLNPVLKTPVEDLNGRLIATRVILANGASTWALLGNIDVQKPEFTKHFLTASFERGGEWFHLARYHDRDYEKRGPKQLAEFMNLPIHEVFPIAYDVSAEVVGPPEVTHARILAEPEQKLTRAEIIALAVP